MKTWSLTDLKTRRFQPDLQAGTVMIQRPQLFKGVNFISPLFIF